MDAETDVLAEDPALGLFGVQEELGASADLPFAGVLFGFVGRGEVVVDEKLCDVHADFLGGGRL